ncbi:aminoglycoside phosphotransferase [Paraburkholderia acidicola]|uniref:Aminoglycoside phosphotransferase n=1 Tax=Paraburkholderia acidicola TaxID=1912599 RepID=A0A2A4F321_9BURK|nr:aminoglycoside phosphotransferase family protein [Paraburkholderia acidicola]PCE27060.1 aminoglycoside phosphotransferase [Paraburkholderia acidicola]
MQDTNPVQIDDRLVQRLIHAQFPEWANLPVEMVEPGGWDNRTFRLGNDKLVRMPSGPAYVAQVEKEHRWLPKLASHLPLPIPVPIVKGMPDSTYPWPWSVYRWIEGEPAKIELIEDMNQFAGSLAGFLDALHQIDVEDGPPAGQHNFHRGGKLAIYDQQIREALTELRDHIDTRTVERLWNVALQSEWQASPVWVHGDIALGNLLVTDGRLSAVIDFGCAAVGDPACDLVIAWTQFSGTSRAVFRRELPFDRDTWNRARGWALWKACIVAAKPDGNQREAERSWIVINEVLSDSY